MLACATLVSACSPPPAVVGAGRPLVIGIVGEPASLLGDDPVGRVVAGAVMEPVVARTPTEELEPRLVVAVPSFANGDLDLAVDAFAPAGRLVATFRLRDGLRWHDGAPLTSADVRFAFEQDRAAPSGSEERSVAERIDRVDVVDDRTFRVAYRAGERWDLFALGPRVLPRHLLEGAGEAARAQYASRPVHAGPFRVEGRSPATIVLEAFADHVLGPPRIRRIVVRSYADRSTLLVAARAGDVDVAPSPDLDIDLSATLDRTFDGGERQVLYTPSQSVAMLRFGRRLADETLRRAVALTVDRERIARAVSAGRARVPNSFLVAPLWAASDTIAPVRIDRSAARTAMERAGWKRGTFGIAEKDGERLIVRLLVPSSPALVEAARGIAIDIAVLGIAAEVDARPAVEVEQRARRGDYDLALVVEPADDPLLATERYRGLVGPWFDVLADQAGRSLDRTEGRALYGELQRLWSDAAVALPIYQPLRVDVAPARLEGVRPPSHGAPLTWDVTAWRLAE